MKVRDEDGSEDSGPKVAGPVGSSKVGSLIETRDVSSDFSLLRSSELVLAGTVFIRVELSATSLGTVCNVIVLDSL
jgi:hypothetical protein